MKMTIRAVRIRVNTLEGAYGRTIKLGPGFNIITGGNARGKSQIVLGIIYALGMERMLKARTNNPMGSALTTEIQTSDGDESVALEVKTSWVAVEMENEAGEVMTVQRYARHPRFDRNLVYVWPGPALTDAALGLAPDQMFLHLPGSASREYGFHHRLTEFLRWDLPVVTTYRGELTKLYPDVIFPFLIVDQQSWGSTGPRKVDRYQIRESIRKSVEFLAGFSGPGTEIRRAELDQAMSHLRTRWATQLGAVESLASSIGGRIVGLPSWGGSCPRTKF
ncbi:hypothetical protein APR12_002171 [Nocardia amikacinitolerans]|uniref:AAA family ATPase n=1 Tax=Nocardia amikacinitolerans TaxID=756689 RepID=UPI000AC61ED5|nr:AAA family ATPase [Nocardia amikacinitolerans]MCP2316831.1 hypothetical protein [Nocardia amikacinitolerans]